MAAETQATHPNVDSSVLFSNLISYHGYFHPFVDRYAQFGVTFEQGRALGVGMAQVRSAAFTNQVSCATLRLWFEEEGQLVAVQRQDLVSLPWCVRERADIASGPSKLRVSARHVYIDEKTLLSEFSFVNTGKEPATFRPRWFGLFSGDRFNSGNVGVRYGYDSLPVRETWATADGCTVRGGLRGTKHSEVLPLPALQITGDDQNGLTASVSTAPPWHTPSDGEEHTTVDGVLGDEVYFGWRADKLTLAAGDTRRFVFTTELSVATRLDPVYHLRKLVPGNLDVDALIADARADFEKRVGLDNPPDVPGDRPALLRKAWRARWALLRTGYRARGRAGEFGDQVVSTCVPSCSGFTRVFFWDSLFSSVAASQFEPELARGSIKGVFARQTGEGLCPEHSFNYHVPARDVIGAPQAPVASWVVRHYLRCQPDDDAFLMSVYGNLVRNHEYWSQRGDRDNDGLAEWIWSGQTADNSPLYDAYTHKACGWLPPVASVHLNAFLYRDAHLLAELADRMELTEEAAEYRASAEARARALMRVCFVEKEKRFWDYDQAANRHNRIKTFYMFWPIWAGMPMDDDTRKDLIENVLLDPGQFFGDIPFPSVAYDEPAYDPRGYWRGRAWPHISYWLLEMLVREGYGDAADEAAGRILSAYSREASFPENLATRAGLYDDAGQADYNWGAAAFYLVATREYARSSSW